MIWKPGPPSLTPLTAMGGEDSGSGFRLLRFRPDLRRLCVVTPLHTQSPLPSESPREIPSRGLLIWETGALAVSGRSRPGLEESEHRVAGEPAGGKSQNTGKPFRHGRILHEARTEDTRSGLGGRSEIHSNAKHSGKPAQALRGPAAHACSLNVTISESGTRSVTSELTGWLSSAVPMAMPQKIISFSGIARYSRTVG